MKKTVFGIRMDPGFFTSPDPDFKNPDLDPSINKLMMFLLRFWRNLTKKDSVGSAKYEIPILFFCTYRFERFFPWIRISFSDPDPEKNKNRIFNTSQLRIPCLLS